MLEIQGRLTTSWILETDERCVKKCSVYVFKNFSAGSVALISIKIKPPSFQHSQTENLSLVYLILWSVSVTQSAEVKTKSNF